MKRYFYTPAVGEEKFSSVIVSKIDSAASIPPFMALCVPFNRATFMKPGLQPAKHPPGNVSFGRHYKKLEVKFLKLVQILHVET